MSCLTNQDCAFVPGAPVCKEMVLGGPKTCQETFFCTAECGTTEFCSAGDICNLISFSLIDFQLSAKNMTSPLLEICLIPQL